ncbi:MAG: 1-acyl-sn-glycerol-3-phosphate acyltransferase [Chloroflexota bacterium]
MVQPPENKYMILCAPHTSNFDALWFFIAVRALGIRPRVLIKSTYHVFPFKRLFTFLGGIPVERGYGARGLADQLVEYIKTVDGIELVIAPEGSRSRQKFWKSGFYQIALGTGLPVYLVSVDYVSGDIRRSERPMPITGDLSADMDFARSFYDGVRAKYPAGSGPVALKREKQKTE